ncbi:MAG: hypothetical protein ACPGR8_13530, partial [Limisphaerales bacterium]
SDLRLSDFNQTDLVKFYAAEQLTAHADGTCASAWHSPHGNNGYVVYTAGTYTYLVSGADQAYECDWLGRQWSVDTPTCKPMRECLADAQCKAEYKREYKIAKSKMHRVASSCWRTWFTVLIAVAASIVLVVVVFVFRWATGRRIASFSIM